MENRRFYIPHCEGEIELINIKSKEGFKEPSKKELERNKFVRHTHLRAEYLRLMISALKEEAKEAKEAKKLQAIEVKKRLKDITSEKGSESVGSLDVGLDNELFAAIEILKNIEDKEREILCLSYNLDANAKTDFVKVVLSADLKSIKEVYFIQVKSNEKASNDSGAKVAQTSLVKESRLHYGSIISKEAALNHLRSDHKQKEVVLEKSNEDEDNYEKNIIKAEKFFSVDVLVEKNDRDQPVSAIFQTPVPIFGSEAEEINITISRQNEEINKLNKEIDKSKIDSEKNKRLKKLRDGLISMRDEYAKKLNK